MADIISKMKRDIAYLLFKSGGASISGLTAPKLLYGSDATTLGSAGGSSPTLGLFWSSANNRLGVNQNTPLYALDVTGTGHFTSTVAVDGNFNLAGILNIASSSFVLQYSGTACYIANNTVTPTRFFINNGVVVALDIQADTVSKFYGTVILPITTTNKTSAYSITASDHTVTGDTTSGAFSVTLPTAVGCAGRIHTIKRVSASANNLTVATTSSQTIDGATTYVLSAQWKYVRVQSNNANWLIIGNN